MRSNRWARMAVVMLSLVLGACANVVTRVNTGEAVIGERLVVPVDEGWNQLPAQGSGYAALWTIDGLPIDQLTFYVGIKDGAPIAPTPGNSQRPLTFKASMQPHEMVALFESLYTRDGSTFTLERLDAVDFLGQRGWRARFTVVRKFDEVKLGGSLWGTVRDGQLHAMAFLAPSHAFYPRLLPRVEKVASAARLR